MPNFILAYDLNINFCLTNNISPNNVYRLISRRLIRNGWTRKQYSVWTSPGPNMLSVRNDITEAFEAAEARYANADQNLFSRVHLQAFITPRFIRHNIAL